MRTGEKLPKHLTRLAKAAGAAYETAECIASTSSPIICTRYETYLVVVFVTLDGKCDPVRCNGAEFRLDWHEAEKQSK